MQLIRYLIVAVLAYLIDMGGFVFLMWLHLGPILSNVLVKILAALFGFFAHRYFTYQIRNFDQLWSHAVKYFGLVLIYTPLSSVCLLLMMKIIKNPIIAKFICDVILFVAVYWVTSKFTFLKPASEPVSGKI